MGNTAGHSNQDTGDVQPIEFHSIHAANVELSHSCRRSRRVDGQRGLCFSHRPIVLGERVYLKVTGVSRGRRHKGVALRYGYTAIDPASDNTTSRQGRLRCNEIPTGEHGYWVKPVNETLAKRGSVLFFSICVGGEVLYGRDDEEYGVLFSGVRTDIPLWVVIDLCGSATSLEFVEVGQMCKSSASDMTKAALAKYEARRSSRLTRSTEALPTTAAEAGGDVASRRFSSARQLRRPVSQQPTTSSAEILAASQTTDNIVPTSSARRATLQPSAGTSLQTMHRSATVPVACSSPSSQLLTSQPTNSVADMQPESNSRSSSAPPVTTSSSSALRAQVTTVNSGAHGSNQGQRTAANNRSAEATASAVSRRYRAADVTESLAFSASVVGRNLRLSADRCTACRLPHEYCNAYVFSERAFLPGEELVVRVTGIDRTYAGGMTVGLTSCNPNTLRVSDLPDSADALLERQEYWVFQKDVCSRPKVNDELAFHRTVSGELRYCRNGREARTLMHIDCLLPLFAFFDVYGTTQKIQSIGIVKRSPVTAVRSHSLRSTNQMETRPVNSSASVTTTTTTTTTAATAALSVTSSVLPPASVQQTVSRPSAGSSISELLFDCPPALPPPLIPVPEGHSSAANSTRLETSSDSIVAASAHEGALLTVQSKVPLPNPAVAQLVSIDQTGSVNTGLKQQRERHSGSECAICMEHEPDCALYPCGHMCMCYECAQSVKQRRSALCPICRQPIIDILRIYRS